MFTKETLNSLSDFEEIFEMSPRDFEWFSKFILESIGHERVKVTPYMKDGGVDVESLFEDEKYYTQSKQWKRAPYGKEYLPVKELRELGGSMLRDGVLRGIFITTLVVYDSAKQEAERMRIDVLDKGDLIDIMKKINPYFEGESLLVQEESSFWVKLGRGLLRALFATLKRLFEVFIDIITSEEENPKRRNGRKKYSKRKKRKKWDY